MLKQTITFKDFNGVERTEDLYFNLTEAELVEMQANSENGIQKDMQDAVLEKDLRKLLDFVKLLVHNAYGVRDRDGLHFRKSPEITADFVNSAMYSPLLLSLFQDEGARTEAFITGLMPADLVQRAIAQSQGQGSQPAPVDASIPQVAPSARERFAAAQAERNTSANEAPPIGAPGAPAQPYIPGNTETTITTLPEELQPAEAPQAFRIRQEPIADPTPEPLTKEAQDLADFEEFKRRRDAGEL